MRYGLLLAAMLWACGAWAQETERKTLPSREACRAVCDEAMKALAGGDVAGAFKMLSPYWAFIPGEFTDLQIRAIKHVTTLAPRFGKCVGQEFVRQELVGDTLIRFTYIQKFERHGLRWEFTFYRPTDRWHLNALAWDENLQRLLDQKGS